MPLFPLYHSAAVAFGAAPDRIAIAVARILAGESPNDVAFDMELGCEGAQEASLRAHALKPTPKARRKRKVAVRWL